MSAEDPRLTTTSSTEARYRGSLPQLGDGVFLTDGGIETTLIFHDGLELPYFAAYTCSTSDDGEAALRRYFAPYVEDRPRQRRRDRARDPDLAREPGLGGVARALPEKLAELNRRAVRSWSSSATEHADARPPIVIAAASAPAATATSWARR